MMEKLAHLLETVVLPWSTSLALAIIIFIVGWWLTKLVVSVVRRIMVSAELDQMLINFLSATLKAVLMVLVGIAALDKLGVATTSMVAMLGAAGLAVGLALQGSLQNFAAGIMMLIFRPFKAGDYVEAAGTAGTVEKLGIFSTTLTSVDNKEVIVPNGNVYRDTIINYSARATRRIDLLIGIGYDSDLSVAKAALQEIIGRDSRILPIPSSQIAVSELAANSVNLTVRAWVKTEDFTTVKWDLTEAIKLRFDAEGIEIPYPQLNVHYQQK